MNRLRDFCAKVENFTQLCQSVRWKVLHQSKKKEGKTKTENKKYGGEICVEEHLVLPAVISVEGAVYVCECEGVKVCVSQ